MFQEDRVDRAKQKARDSEAQSNGGGSVNSRRGSAQPHVEMSVQHISVGTPPRTTLPFTAAVSAAAEERVYAERTPIATTLRQPREPRRAPTDIDSKSNASSFHSYEGTRAAMRDVDAIARSYYLSGSARNLLSGFSQFVHDQALSMAPVGAPTDTPYIEDPINVEQAWRNVLTEIDATRGDEEMEQKEEGDVVHEVGGYVTQPMDERKENAVGEAESSVARTAEEQGTEVLYEREGSEAQSAQNSEAGCEERSVVSLSAR